MSQESKAQHRELRARSLDVIKVHNPTQDDYIMWNDKYGPSAEKVLIPNVKKDIGFGNGNNHLPRFLAKRYCRAMVEKIITKIADDAWEKKKKEYRTLDETIQHADKVGIRTNDRKLWEEWTPKIWLGTVEKFGGEALPDPPDPIIRDSGDPMSDTFKGMGLDEKEYEPTTETVDEPKKPGRPKKL